MTLDPLTAVGTLMLHHMLDETHPFVEVPLASRTARSWQQVWNSQTNSMRRNTVTASLEAHES